MDSAVPPFWTSCGQFIGRVVDAPARMTIDKIVPPFSSSFSCRTLGVSPQHSRPKDSASSYQEQIPSVKAGGQTGTVRNYRNTDALDGVLGAPRNNLMCPRCVPSQRVSRFATLLSPSPLVVPVIQSPPHCRSGRDHLHGLPRWGRSAVNHRASGWRDGRNWVHRAKL